ncbi:MAG: prolipoprotein diacylglyceryl transferase [Bacteroidetes bacterium]|nr:prolipoprotein diacylglyceryl transferase [Bacteroidota bacterium]
MFPVLFESKYFIIHTYWLFLSLAFIVFIYSVITLSHKEGLKIQFLSDNALKFFFWSFIGARIVGIIENYYIYFSEFSIHSLARIFFIWDKGLNIWGAILGFLIIFFITCRKEEQDFWKWLDILVPSFLIAMAIRSLGAFFDGINYGNETDLPWGVNFEKPAIKYTVPIHPTQIYSFLYCSTLAGIYLQLSKKMGTLREKNLSGLFALIFSFAFFILAFLEQFLRGDDVLMLAYLRVPQIIMGFMVIFTGVIIYLRYNKGKSKKPKINRTKHGIHKNNA